MNADELLAALLGTKVAFEAALSQVSGVAAAELLVRLLKDLESEATFDNAERERRLSAIFRRCTLDASGCTEVAQAGAGLSNGVLRNALAQLLPAEFRTVVFRRKQSDERPNAGTAVASVKTPIGSPVAVESDPRGSGNAFSDVIILSIVENPATTKLLEESGFTPLRCQSIDELERMIATNEEICAFLVASSYLGGVDGDGQSKLIEKLACFSSFAWLRFEADKLVASEVSVAQQIAHARCRVSG